MKCVLGAPKHDQNEQRVFSVHENNCLCNVFDCAFGKKRILNRIQTITARGLNLCVAHGSASQGYPAITSTTVRPRLTPDRIIELHGWNRAAWVEEGCWHAPPQSRSSQALRISQGGGEAVSRQDSIATHAQPSSTMILSLFCATLTTRWMMFSSRKTRSCPASRAHFGAGQGVLGRCAPERDAVDHGPCSDGQRDRGRRSRYLAAVGQRPIVQSPVDSALVDAATLAQAASDQTRAHRGMPWASFVATISLVGTLAGGCVGTETGNPGDDADGDGTTLNTELLFQAVSRNPARLRFADSSAEGPAAVVGDGGSEIIDTQVGLGEGLESLTLREANLFVRTVRFIPEGDCSASPTTHTAARPAPADADTSAPDGAPRPYTPSRAEGIPQALAADASPSLHAFARTLPLQAGSSSALRMNVSEGLYCGLEVALGRLGEDGLPRDLSADLIADDRSSGVVRRSAERPQVLRIMREAGQHYTASDDETGRLSVTLDLATWVTPNPSVEIEVGASVDSVKETRRRKGERVEDGVLAEVDWSDASAQSFSDMQLFPAADAHGPDYHATVARVGDSNMDISSFAHSYRLRGSNPLVAPYTMAMDWQLIPHSPNASIIEAHFVGPDGVSALQVVLEGPVEAGDFVSDAMVVGRNEAGGLMQMASCPAQSTLRPWNVPAGKYAGLNEAFDYFTITSTVTCALGGSSSSNNAAATVSFQSVVSTSPRR